jgi:hypothetical protein
VVTGTDPDIIVARNAPDMPKKDWHAMDFMKGTSYEVGRAVNEAYLAAKCLETLCYQGIEVALTSDSR